MENSVLDLLALKLHFCHKQATMTLASEMPEILLDCYISTPFFTKRFINFANEVCCMSSDYSRILEDILCRDSYWVIGKRAIRVDALEKVLGEAKFTADYLSKEMLHVKVARSVHPHAIIKRVNKNKALKVKGVVNVITANDLPGENQIGYYIPDQPLLVKDKARFIGDSIALVVGKDEYCAENGLDALEIEYEPLKPIFDPEEALKPEASKIHEKGNIARTFRVRKGDVRTGFTKADVIVENTYNTQHQEHAYIEPEAAIGIPESGGRITVVGTQQNPFDVRNKIAKVLGIGQNKVRIVTPYLGGGFGGKDTMGPIVCATAAVAAALTKKPTILTFTREESIMFHGKRVPFDIRYKTGASKDGKLTATEIDITANVGGYATQGVALTKRAVIHSTGPYEVPTVKVDARCVYTNRIFPAAFNGFGNPQIQFAAESQMDELAEKLGIDPLEFRLKNVLKPGSRTGTDQLLDHSAGLEEALFKIGRVAGWERKRKEYAMPQAGTRRRGIGVGCSWHGNGTTGVKQDFASASIILNSDGTVTCRTEIVELGQGTHTGDMMIVAEILGVPMHQICVESPDTTALPEGGQTHAQRGITIGGAAVANAAIKLRKKLNTLASEILRCKEEEVEIKEGKAFIRHNPSKNVPFEQLVDELYANGISPAEYGFSKSPREDIDPETGLGHPYGSYTFGCNIAEVEVDIETGIIDVLRIFPGLDAGKVIEPELVRGQMHGCTIMGLGYAIMEDLVVKDGVVQNPNLTDYIIPTIADKPEIPDCVMVEHPYRYSAFGAKGVGEIALIATPPAIVNAIYQAIGIRFRELPVTSDKVYFALKERGDKK